jgi:hypothetical protein
MSEPYENVYLGNFILTLGYLAGQRNIPLNCIAVEQLQQTPGDTAVGDLFASWQGRNFIFEFKRREANVRWEFRKENRVRFLHAINDKTNGKARTLFTASTMAHFVCFPSSTPSSTLAFLPYVRIIDSASQDSSRAIDLTRFCAALLEHPPRLGMTYKHLPEYLDLLSGAHEEGSGSSGGSAVIMNISDDGGIGIVVADTLQVLAKALDTQKEPPVLEKGFEMEVPKPRGQGR